MLRMFVIVALLVACGDDSPASSPDAAPPATCEHATVYGGHVYDCEDGVCVVSHGAVSCQPKCGTAPACSGGFQWMTLTAENNQNVCYCDTP
jgi:hypothetical protein